MVFKALLEKSKERPAWGLGLLLSIVYFAYFIMVSSGEINPGLLFGFCVWGNGDEEPTKEVGCAATGATTNSHLVALGIDVIMTALVAVFYFLDKNPKKENFSYFIYYIAFGFIILAHGLLHAWIGSPSPPGIDCYLADTSKYVRLGYILFAAFSFFLALIILSFGFQFGVPSILGSGLFAFVVVQITQNAGGGNEYFLPGLFCVVHPLSCFTGLFANSIQGKAMFSETVGRLFVITTLVGICELAACDDWFKSIGGHFYYDLTLHSAIVAALPYFTFPGSKKKRI